MWKGYRKLASDNTLVDGKTFKPRSFLRELITAGSWMAGTWLCGGSGPLLVLHKEGKRVEFARIRILLECVNHLQCDNSNVL